MVPTRSRNIGLILRDRGVQAASLVALVVIWAVFATLIGTFGGTSIVPGPFDVAPRFATLITSGEWVAPLLETLSRTGVGFAVAFVAGIVIGITTAKVPVFRMTTSPLLRVPPSCPARAPLPRQVITDHLHAHIAPVPSDMLQSQTYIPAVTQAQRNGFMRG